MTKAAYESRLSNLKYNLETNGQYMSEHDKEMIRQRIQDYTDFIDTLIRLGL